MSGGAERRRRARHIRVVLHRDRDAMENTPCLPGHPVEFRRPIKCLLGEHDPVGVQQRIQVIDAPQRGIDEFTRRHLAGGDHPSLLRRAGHAQVGETHRSDVPTNSASHITSCADLDG